MGNEQGKLPPPGKGGRVGYATDSKTPVNSTPSNPVTVKNNSMERKEWETHEEFTTRQSLAQAAEARMQSKIIKKSGMPSEKLQKNLELDLRVQEEKKSKMEAVLATYQASSPALQNSTSSNGNESKQDFVETVPNEIPDLDHAIAVLLSNSAESITSALRIFQVILVINKPSENQYRRVKIASKPIQTLLSIPGAVEILRSCGFEHDEEYAFLLDSVSIDHLKSCLYYLNEIKN